MLDEEACSKIDQRSVIKFLVADGCKAVENHRRMSIVYAATCFIKNKHKEQTQEINIKNKRKKDIKNKCRGHQSKRVIVHHDNTRPHTARWGQTYEAVAPPPSTGGATSKFRWCCFQAQVAELSLQVAVLKSQMAEPKFTSTCKFRWRHLKLQLAPPELRGGIAATFMSDPCCTRVHDN